MFSIEAIAKKQKDELEFLKLISEGKGDKICRQYGLEPLPEDPLRWHRADYKCQYQITENAAAVLMYILVFHIKRDRIFCVSSTQIEQGLHRHFDIKFSRSKCHRLIKELEEKEVLETIVQVKEGTFYIFKLTE